MDLRPSPGSHSYLAALIDDLLEAGFLVGVFPPAHCVTPVTVPMNDIA
jgi:hypothetical protein